MSQYQILRVELPLVGGIASHNYLVVKDSSGNVIGEMNGLATGEDGKIKPIGYKPSDRLKVYEHKTYFYDGSHSEVVLHEGSKSDVLRKKKGSRNNEVFE